MKHLVIIDGYGFVFRSYHSMPPLTRKDGTEVGAVFGFTNMMVKLLSDIDATHIGVIFDSGGKNFRHQIYSEYKAHRPPVPENLIEQFPIVRQSVHALNISTMEMNGFEADDIIATLANKASIDGFKVTIVSSDKDLMQLINENIMLYDPMKSKFIGKDQVFEKFGVFPDKVRDVLALMGDSADNIPGVKGIGPKGAAELINNYSSIEGIYNQIGGMKSSKKKEQLINCKSDALMSYELVGLDKFVPINQDLDFFIKKIPNDDELKQFLEKNGFRSLASKISSIKNNIENSKSTISINNFVSNIDSKKFDSLEEFNNSNKYNKILVLLKEESKILLGYDDLSYCYVDENEDITSLLSNENIIKITFDAKKIAKLYNIKNQYIVDIQLIAYLIDSSLNNNNLTDLMNNFYQDYFDLTSPVVKIQFIIDCYNKFLSKLQSTSNISLYFNIEQKLQPILQKIEDKGIKIDINYLKDLSNYFTEKMEIISSQIFEICGVNFNIGSPKQLGTILFEKMKLPNPKKTKTGYSTDVETLEQLSISGHVIADKILDWRQLQKLNSTYTLNLVDFVDDFSRLHTNFSQTSTITGRLSSSHPNLQNIPTKTEEGKKIRKAFIASEENFLLSADYSQIELRILAHFANIDQLIDAFHNNQDIHSITASEIFGIKLENITPDLRRKAKAVNFGIIYGISPYGLAKQLLIDTSEAKQIIEKYFDTYKGIKEYMNLMQEKASDLGYVETILKRRCYIKDINSSNHNVRSFASRLAINAPIQGSAADIIKLATIEVSNKTNYSNNIVLQVHDELIFEIKKDEILIAEKNIKSIMENIITLKTPLIVDVSHGNNWQEL